MLERNPTSPKFLDRKEMEFGDFIVRVIVSIASFTPRELEQTFSMPVPLRMKRKTCCGIVASSVGVSRLSRTRRFLLYRETFSGEIYTVSGEIYEVSGELYTIDGCRCL